MAVYHHSTTGTTRTADLDTQRHVTSRTYEYLCYAARTAWLESRGHSQDEMLSQGHRLVPLSCHSAFKSQQMAGVTLTVETEIHNDSARIVWDHTVKNKDDIACRIVVETETRDQTGSPISLFDDASDAVNQARSVLKEPGAFTNSCNTVELKTHMLYSDRDIFGTYPPAALWRLLEEGRWHFSSVCGLTYETFVDLDTTAFFMGGTSFFYQGLKAGEPIVIRAWIERIEKIRAYMRLDVFREGDTEPAISTREESLIVSLSRARPRRAPAEYVELIRDYIEFPN